MTKIWNHNIAYHKWVKKKVENKNRILDVGCGDGTLCEYLKNNKNDITGIDIDKQTINKAKNNNKEIKYINASFLDYDFKNTKYDAIIFVASIHHMDMEEALTKCKKLLSNKGILLIVGLSKPSNLLDYLIEIVRIIPSKIISTFKRNQTSEELNLKVDYDFPTMKYVRDICKKELKNNYKIKYGIHYRYLLEWTKQNI